MPNARHALASAILIAKLAHLLGISAFFLPDSCRFSSQLAVKKTKKGEAWPLPEGLLRFAHHQLAQRGEIRRQVM